MSIYPSGSTMFQRATIDRIALETRHDHGRVIIAPHRDRHGHVTIQSRVGFAVMTYRIDMHGIPNIATI